MVLAILFRPLVRWLERCRLPASLASGVVVVSIVLATIGFVWIVVVGIIREGDALLTQLKSVLGELGIADARTRASARRSRALSPP